MDVAVSGTGDCVVCMDGSATHAIVPCGHQVLCAKCAGIYGPHGEHTSCPLCRRAVGGVFKIFVTKSAEVPATSSRDALTSVEEIEETDNQKRPETTMVACGTGPAPEAPLHGASARASSSAPSGTPAIPDTLQRLMDMGFEQRSCETALISSEGNVEVAVAILVSSSLPTPPIAAFDVASSRHSSTSRSCSHDRIRSRLVPAEDSSTSRCEYRSRSVSRAPKRRAHSSSYSRSRSIRRTQRRNRSKRLSR